MPRAARGCSLAACTLRCAQAPSLCHTPRLHPRLLALIDHAHTRQEPGGRDQPLACLPTACCLPQRPRLAKSKVAARGSCSSASRCCCAGCAVPPVVRPARTSSTTIITTTWAALLSLHNVTSRSNPCLQPAAPKPPCCSYHPGQGSSRRQNRGGLPGAAASLPCAAAGCSGIRQLCSPLCSTAS